MAVAGICVCDQSMKLHEKEKAALEMKIPDWNQAHFFQRKPQSDCLSGCFECVVITLNF